MTMFKCFFGQNQFFFYQNNNKYCKQRSKLSKPCMVSRRLGLLILIILTFYQFLSSKMYTKCRLPTFSINTLIFIILTFNQFLSNKLFTKCTFPTFSINTLILIKVLLKDHIGFSLELQVHNADTENPSNTVSVQIFKYQL